MKYDYVLREWQYSYDYWGRWCLTGICEERFFNNKVCYTSKPVAFDQENMIVTTKSGSKYLLSNCAKENVDSQIKYIMNDVKNANSQPK